MKIEIKTGDGVQRLAVEGEVILSDVFGGVGIDTEQGRFGIAMRDSGIEVLLDGKHAWASYDLGDEFAAAGPAPRSNSEQELWDAVYKGEVAKLVPRFTVEIASNTARRRANEAVGCFRRDRSEAFEGWKHP